MLRCPQSGPDRPFWCRAGPGWAHAGHTLPGRMGRLETVVLVPNCHPPASVHRPDSRSALPIIPSRGPAAGAGRLGFPEKDANVSGREPRACPLL